MHSFRSTRSLARLRIGSFFYLLFIVTFVLILPAILWEKLLGRPYGLIAAAALTAACILSALIYLLVGSNVRCPLCHGPLLGNPRCSRNRNAQRTFGSYRLAVACRVMFLGRFRCPCCGEACRCQARR